MVYIIIAIVAFLLVKKLITSSISGIGKLINNIFFDPRVNSVITIIFSVCYLISDTTLFSEGLRPLCKVLWILSIIDCVRDFVAGEDYYRTPRDPLYVIKSITSILTLGMSRGFFFLVVGPLIHYGETKALREAVESGQPVSPCCSGSLRAQEYYYDMELEWLLKQGKLVSNEKTVREEIARSQRKLDKLYPKKFLEKIVDAVAGDDEVKEQRDRGEAGIKRLRYSRTYISKAVYDQIPNALVEAMRDKGTLCAADIIKLEELERFDFGKGCCGETFLIQALEPLVENGTFLDDDISDDPLENHAYRYAHSSKQKKSIDASSDPRFAL